MHPILDHVLPCERLRRLILRAVVRQAVFTEVYVQACRADRAWNPIRSKDAAMGLASHAMQAERASIPDLDAALRVLGASSHEGVLLRYQAAQDVSSALHALRVRAGCPAMVDVLRQATARRRIAVRNLLIHFRPCCCMTCVS